MRLRSLCLQTVSVCAAVSIFCSSPQNPFTDPDNVRLSLYTADSTLSLHAQTDVEIDIYLPALIDTLLCTYSGAAPVHDTIVIFASPAIADTVLHRYHSWSDTADTGRISVLVIMRIAQTGQWLRDSIEMILGLAPRFCSRPELRGIPRIGSACSLLVCTIGSDSITYRWLHNDRPVPNATRDVLHFDSLQHSNGGTYRCVATSVFGVDTSASLLVTPESTGCVLTTVVPLFPQHAAIAVENSNLVFSWTASCITEFDGVRYILRYGLDASSLSLGAVVSDTFYVPLTALRGSSDYFWTITVVAGNDSVRSPAVGTFYFRTRNHPAMFSIPLKDTAISIHDTLALFVQAQDPEGIVEYQWDLNGNGIIDAVTTAGTVVRVFADTGTYTVIVGVKDNFDSLTYNSCTVWVTNHAPQVYAGADTAVGLGDTVRLRASASDDGRILSVTWNIARWNAYNPEAFGHRNGTDTVFRAPDRDLPDSLLCVVRAIDDDGNVSFDSLVVYANMRWTKVTDDAPWGPRWGHSVIVFKDSLWLTGGNNASVWSSGDGETWMCRQPSAPFGTRYNSGVDTLDGALFVYGGIRNTMEYCNDVWSSTDGINWIRVDSSGSWNPKIGSGYTSFMGKLQIIGGGFVDGPDCYTSSCKDTWQSHNGREWKPGGKMAHWRFAPSCIVTSDTLRVYGGHGGYSDLQSIPEICVDGMVWQTEPQPAPFGGRMGMALIEHRKNIWAIGGSTGNFTPYLLAEDCADDIWRRDNNGVWIQIVKHTNFRRRTDFAVASFRNRIWVFSGTTDGYTRLSDIWYSENLLW